MTVYVEACVNDRFRLTLKDGRRYVIRGEAWTREVKQEARRVLAVETGRDESSFRFTVH